MGGGSGVNRETQVILGKGVAWARAARRCLDVSSEILSKPEFYCQLAVESFLDMYSMKSVHWPQVSLAPGGEPGRVRDSESMGKAVWGYLSAGRSSPAQIESMGLGYCTQ